MKVLEFGAYDFTSKKELFTGLYEKQHEIIDLKKSNVYKSCEKGGISIPHQKDEYSIKSIEGAKSGFIYPIISTTKFMDSHSDVHFDGCFNKTLKEQQGKVKYILDHQLNYDSVIAWQKDVVMSVKNIDWGVVGKSFQGQTEALIFEISKDAIKRKDVLLDIENKVGEFENSIRMVYHKITLGMNSELKEHKENKEYFEKRISSIVNKDEVLESGYFWGVEQLGIYKEGSLVVAGGSNSATSIFEAANSTSSKIEPPKSTQSSNKNRVSNLLYL